MGVSTDLVLCAQYDKPNYEDDGGLVIFRDEKAAAHVLSRSPIRFTLKRLKEQDTKILLLGREDEGSVGSIPGRVRGANELRTPSVLMRHSKRYAEYKRKQQEAQKLQEEKEKEDALDEGPVLIDQEFLLRAERWEGSHRAYNERTKFFNPFKPDHHSPIREDLAKRVPLRSLANVIMEPPEGEIPLWKLRKYAAEVEQRPRLRDWVNEREKGKRGKRDLERSRSTEKGRREKEDLGGLRFPHEVD